MKVITICGSTRFKTQFETSIRLLIRAGWFVRSVEIFDVDRTLQITKEYKNYLCDAHFDKIAKSDAIYVVNVDGYIGISTNDEITYAKLMRIPIYYRTDDGIPKPNEILD